MRDAFNGRNPEGGYEALGRLTERLVEVERERDENMAEALRFADHALRMEAALREIADCVHGPNGVRLPGVALDAAVAIARAALSASDSGEAGVTRASEAKRYREEELQLYDSMPAVTRCAFRGQSHSGTALTGRVWASKHRLRKHPEAQADLEDEPRAQAFSPADSERGGVIRHRARAPKASAPDRDLARLTLYSRNGIPPLSRENRAPAPQRALLLLGRLPDRNGRMEPSSHRQ